MFAASKSGSAVAKDPQFNYVTMLLHGDGTNGAQNNTFLDSSTNNFTITRNGNTTQGTFTPYGSNWSNYFDGSSDLRIASNAAFALGTSDFTCEMWIYPPSWATAAPIFVVAGTGGLWIGKFNSNFVIRAYGVADQLQYATMPTTNTWTHVVAVRSGTTLSLYYNGSRVATTTNSYNFAQAALGIGSDRDTITPTYYTGYLSNLRLVKGTAVYDPTASTITVPKTPLTAISGTSLLTCQSNRFIDNSSNAFAITTTGSPSVQRFSPFSPTTAYSTSVIGGSGYFDGSGDYLRVAYNSNLYPTTTGTDYTVECWLYPTAGTTGLQYILGTNNTAVADWGFTQDAGQWGFTLSGTGGNAGTVIANQWTHIAMTRNGTTVNGYVNGVRVLTTTALTQSNNNLPMNIGMRNGSDRPFTGYISDVRIVNGTAVYTGTSYTIPTAPLTAISNTQFLGNYTNASILDNAEMNDLETVGNAQISTSVKKYGTGSMAFDGTGDWLVTPYNPNWILSGDFTIELWLYWTAHGSYGGIVGCANSNTGSAISAGWFLDFNSSSNNLQFEGQGGVSVVTTNVIPSSQWVHIAVVRSGSTITHYLNGVANGSGTSSTSFNSSTFPLYVGVDRGASSTLTGYIDDLRITKGYARYTANFTPPTAAFPNN